MNCASAANLSPRCVTRKACGRCRRVSVPNHNFSVFRILEWHYLLPTHIKQTLNTSGLVYWSFSFWGPKYWGTVFPTERGDGITTQVHIDFGICWMFENHRNPVKTVPSPTWNHPNMPLPISIYFLYTVKSRPRIQSISGIFLYKVHIW